MERSTWLHAADRVQQDIIRLGRAGLEPQALRAAYIKQMRRVIPIDMAFFAMVDPASLLFTASTVDECLAAICLRLMEHELLAEDVNKFNWLPRTDPVGHLHAVTQGRLERSLRYREIYMPMELGDELRAVLRVGDLNWGAVCLHRTQSSPNFTAAEAEFLGRVAPHMAAGLRMSLLLGQALESRQANGSGVIMLTDDCALLGMTPAARHWLDDIAPSDWQTRHQLPTAVYALATRLRQIDRADTTTPQMLPQVRVRTISGQWLVLSASRLSGQLGQGPIAIVMEPARPIELAPLLAQAYDLSPREREVMQLVLRGLSTSEISTTLHVSANTVQDHLKAIFDKMGIRSRRELVALVFAQPREIPMQVA